MRYYNIELNKNDAEKFRRHLKENKIRYEASGCFNLIHFEVLLDESQVEKENKWLDENIIGG